MTGVVTVKVSGLSELGNALKEFPEVIGKKYLARATFTAAALIETDAISRAPFRTGALRSHIAIFKRTGSDKSQAHYAIGVRQIRLSRKVKNVLRIVRKNDSGRRTSIEGDVHYWWFVEFGHKIVKNGRIVGNVSAKPFMRPAFEANKRGAIELFRASLAEGVIAAAKEVVKK